MQWVCTRSVDIPALRDKVIPDKFAKDGSVQKFVGPEPSLGDSRQNIRKIRHWLDNQHWESGEALVVLRTGSRINYGP